MDLVQVMINISQDFSGKVWAIGANVTEFVVVRTEVCRPKYRGNLGGYQLKVVKHRSYDQMDLMDFHKRQ